MQVEFWKSLFLCPSWRPFACKSCQETEPEWPLTDSGLRSTHQGTREQFLYASSVCFNGGKNAWTSCLEFLQCKYFLNREINRTTFTTVTTLHPCPSSLYWMTLTCVMRFTESYLIPRLRIVLVTLDSPAYQCNRANVTLIAVSAFRENQHLLQNESDIEAILPLLWFKWLRTYFIGDLSEWKCLPVFPEWICRGVLERWNYFTLNGLTFVVMYCLIKWHSSLNINDGF